MTSPSCGCATTRPKQSQCRAELSKSRCYPTNNHQGRHTDKKYRADSQASSPLCDRHSHLFDQQTACIAVQCRSSMEAGRAIMVAMAVPARTSGLLHCAAGTIPLLAPRTRTTCTLHLTARRCFGASSSCRRQTLDPRNKFAPKEYLGKEIVDDYAILRDQYGELGAAPSIETSKAQVTDKLLQKHQRTPLSWPTAFLALLN